MAQQQSEKIHLLQDQAEYQETPVDPVSRLMKWRWLPYTVSLAGVAGIGLNIYQYIIGLAATTSVFISYFSIVAIVYASAIVCGIPLLFAIQRQNGQTTATHHFKGLNLMFSVLFILSGVHKVWLFIHYANPDRFVTSFGDAVTIIHYLSEAYLYIWLLSTTFRPYSIGELGTVKGYYKSYLVLILSVNFMALSRLFFVDRNGAETNVNSVPFVLGTCDITYRFLELSYILKLMFFVWKPLEQINLPVQQKENQLENDDLRKQRHAFYGGLGLSLIWATVMSIVLLQMWSECQSNEPTSDCENHGAVYMILFIIGHILAVCMAMYLIITVRAANAWDASSFAPHIQLLFSGALTATVYIILFIFDIGKRFSHGEINLTLGAEICAMFATISQAMFILYFYKTKGTINGRSLPVRMRWMGCVAFFIGYHIGIILLNFLSAKTMEFRFVGGFEAVIFAVAEVMHIIAAFMCIDIADPSFLGA